VAALIDGVDVVVTAVPGPVASSVVSRLAARARQRGSLLVPFGDWAGADVHLRVGEGHWEGLGFGRGRLRRREVTVVAQGRGAAARPRQITMWMPGVAVRSASIPPGPRRTDDGAGTARSRVAGAASELGGPRSAADATMPSLDGAPGSGLPGCPSPTGLVIGESAGLGRGESAASGRGASAGLVIGELAASGRGELAASGRGELAVSGRGASAGAGASAGPGMAEPTGPGMRERS
jgi:hypothetical protein